MLRDKRCIYAFSLLYTVFDLKQTLMGAYISTSTSTETPSWNLSPSNDVASSGQCMNTGCHYYFIALGYENELLHIPAAWDVHTHAAWDG